MLINAQPISDEKLSFLRRFDGEGEAAFGIERDSAADEAVAVGDGVG